jgi:ribosomal protein S27E
MMLSRIEPGPAHSDFLTFECPKCEHVQKMVVGDPMKAVGGGGLLSQNKGARVSHASQ